MMKLLSLLIVLITSQSNLSAQVVAGVLNQNRSNEQIATCGSHSFMLHIDEQNPGYLQSADNWLQSITEIVNTQTAYKRNEVLTIPVVFHVLYQDPSENLPDSVLENQIDILNKAFNHMHADTASLRAEFKPLVGVADIEFVLADKDPNGLATNGIVRTETSISNFGGILPYAQNQTAEIQKWVADSLYYNLFRITHSNKGGSDEWNPRMYLNIWIGDLRIFEPKVNNMEELVFFGLATPPANHAFWQVETLPKDIKSSGVLLHYVAVGGNNPNNYPSPYDIFNGSAKQGKIAVHETGHYLGLRHIWGDGTDCTVDDFIDDTPLCKTSSNFSCASGKNTCTDSINGLDLPDMIENYMDYTSGKCQYAFTKKQVLVMRDVYVNYRQNPSSAEAVQLTKLISVYPNPSQGIAQIHAENDNTLVVLKDLNGKVLFTEYISGQKTLNFKQPAGIYLLEAADKSGKQVIKVVIQ